MNGVRQGSRIADSLSFDSVPPARDDRPMSILLAIRSAATTTTTATGGRWRMRA